MLCYCYEFIFKKSVLSCFDALRPSRLLTSHSFYYWSLRKFLSFFFSELSLYSLFQSGILKTLSRTLGKCCISSASLATNTCLSSFILRASVSTALSLQTCNQMTGVFSCLLQDLIYIADLKRNIETNFKL